MAGEAKLMVVFVHGWSVTNTNTYGEFPERLKAEARRDAGFEIDTRNIWLGKYVSFHDEVRLSDISRAFEAAIRNELADVLKNGGRFACITHSTGGPVIRDWWNRYYLSRPHRGLGPMSHLVMLAPANFGSALGQLGKQRIGRIKSWFAGVEPGEGVLEWLELGSPEAWDLNKSWIHRDSMTFGRRPVFPFVLTGQSIDHALYDHVNAYTGELGSDGVVRVAAANLNATYVKLVQQTPENGGKKDNLLVDSVHAAPQTAFRILPNLSHSGSAMGILRSVKNDGELHATVDSVLRCLKIKTQKQYTDLCEAFANETARIQNDEIVETRSRLLLSDHQRIRDPFSMTIFRLCDEHGSAINDYDLKLTAGKRSSPNHLPRGFIHDTQRNSKNPNHLTFFLNHGILMGTEVPGRRKAVKRQSELIGLEFDARPDQGFVHFESAILHSAVGQLGAVLRPNQTVMVDVEIKRVVHEGVFRMTQDTKPASFKRVTPGKKLQE